MQTRPLFRPVRAFLFPLLIALVVSMTGSVRPGIAAEPAPELQSGTVWSTDLDGNGSTGLNDLAIFVCAYLGNSCPPCPYTNCAPHTLCNSTCPLVFPPCDCGSGVPSWKADFTCDDDGRVGLSDFSIMAIGYLQGTVTGKCE